MARRTYGMLPRRRNLHCMASLAMVIVFSASLRLFFTVTGAGFCGGECIKYPFRISFYIVIPLPLLA